MKRLLITVGDDGNASVNAEGVATRDEAVALLLGTVMGLTAENPLKPQRPILLADGALPPALRRT